MLSQVGHDDYWKALETKQAIIHPEFWVLWDKDFMTSLDCLERTIHENIGECLPVNRAVLVEACLNSMERVVKSLIADDGYADPKKTLAVSLPAKMLLQLTLKNYLHVSYALFDEWGTDKSMGLLMAQGVVAAREFIDRLRKV